MLINLIFAIIGGFLLTISGKIDKFLQNSYIAELMGGGGLVNLGMTSAIIAAIGFVLFFYNIMVILTDALDRTKRPVSPTSSYGKVEDTTKPRIENSYNTTVNVDLRGSVFIGNDASPTLLQEVLGGRVKDTLIIEHDDNS